MAGGGGGGTCEARGADLAGSRRVETAAAPPLPDPAPTLPWMRLPRGGAKGTEERGGQGPPRRKRREHWEAAWIRAGARPRDVCAWGEGEEDRVSVREREERDGGRSGCGTYLQNHNGAPPKQCAISIKNSNGASGKSAPLLVTTSNGALCLDAPLVCLDRRTS